MHIQWKKMQPALINRRDSVLLHDYGRPHDTRLTLQTFTDMGHEILQYPPYYADFPPTEYEFFKYIVISLSQWKEEAKTAFKESLAPQLLEFYRKSINNLMAETFRFFYFDGFKLVLN